MTYVKTVWQDHITEYLNRYSEEINGDGSKTMTPVPGELIQQGTPMSADNFNNLETGVEAAHTDIGVNASNISLLSSRMALQERLLTATIPTTGWSGTAPYSVAVTVPGLTDSRPDINPIYSATLVTARLENEAWNKISYIICTENTMTVTCLDEIPTTAINVELVGG